MSMTIFHKHNWFSLCVKKKITGQIYKIYKRYIFLQIEDSLLLL